MIGSIVFASEQGLGFLAKDFYDNGIIEKVLIQPHSRRTSHPNWFPNSRLNTQENLPWLFEGIDTLLFFETPFTWKVIPMARQKGIKTVLMPMYECTQFPLPYEPDLIICPSLLDLEYYKEKNSIFLPVPVKVPWKLRTKARVFVHNAGNGGLGGRNGTKDILEAMKYVKSPLKLIIRMQEGNYTTNDPRIEIRRGNVPYEELWDEGDVFLFPEKFNGLSLPLQEAFASGMLVMCGNRFPMNTWLSKEPLILVKEYKKERISVEFESAVFDPQVIARTMDDWYGKNITSFSLQGQLWAKQNGWENLKREYINICAK